MTKQSTSGMTILVYGFAATTLAVIAVRVAYMQLFPTEHQETANN